MYIKCGLILILEEKKCKYIILIYYFSIYNGIWILIDIYIYKISMVFGIIMIFLLYICLLFKLIFCIFGLEWLFEMVMIKLRRFLLVLVVVKEILIVLYCCRFFIKWFYRSFFSSKMSYLIKILVIKIV